MARAKRNVPGLPVADGRKNNGRQPGTKIKKAPKLTPAKLNKAKRDRIKLYSVNAIRQEFGSEEEFFMHLAKESRKSYNHLKLLMEYGYGKPEDAHSAPPQKNAPIINFYGAPQIQQDNTIDIDYSDESEDE